MCAGLGAGGPHKSKAPGPLASALNDALPEREQLRAAQEDGVADDGRHGLHRHEALLPFGMRLAPLLGHVRAGRVHPALDRLARRDAPCAICRVRITSRVTPAQAPGRQRVQPQVLRYLKLFNKMLRRDREAEEAERLGIYFAERSFDTKGVYQAGGFTSAFDQAKESALDSLLYELEGPMAEARRATPHPLASPPLAPPSSIPPAPC